MLSALRFQQRLALARRRARLAGFDSTRRGRGHLRVHPRRVLRLLRNPAVLKHPLPADEAVEVIQTYRTHPRWRLIGFPTESRLHDALWQKARATAFAVRKLYDARSALTMTSQGVTEFATANVKDFEGLGFRKVWNPLVQ